MNQEGKMGITPQKATLKELLLYFVKLGTTGFGGPIALVSYMHRDLIEKKNWFSDETFKEGLAMSQIAPGPLAAQLAIYLGWFHSGIVGASLTGLAFILPSFFMVVTIAALYVHFGALDVIQKLFHGVGPAAIAIVCLGAYKLSKRNLINSWELGVIAIINGLVVALTQAEMISVLIVSGLGFMVYKTKFKTGLGLFSIIPPMMLNGVGGEARSGTLWAIFVFFLKSGAFVFGSGLAIVPFLHGGVVVEHQWLNEAQFMDAVAVALITPGPVVITVGFIGFLVAGLAGATVAAVGTFVPCYLATVLPAPYYSRFAKHKYLKEFISGVTSATVGAIFGAVFVLGKQSLVSIPSVLIFLVTLGGLIYLKKIPEPIWIILAALVGYLM